jgi:transcriptional regulator GlxA family with amidase domain
MISVQVLVLRGAMLSSVAITLDVLATANRLRVTQGRPNLFQVSVAGSGAAAVRAWFGPASPAAPAPAVVIIPGLGMTSEAEVRARLLASDARKAMASIPTALAAGAEIATSCSGSFLVAASGVLAGRRATTAWWLAPTFSRMFPEVALEPEAVQVRDGQITTAGAALAQVDLMLGSWRATATPRSPINAPATCCSISAVAKRATWHSAISPLPILKSPRPRPGREPISTPTSRWGTWPRRPD